MNPYGIWVVGAACRIEMIGSSGVEGLAYISEGGPTIKITMKIGDKTIEENNHSVYGPLKEGWHWFNEKLAGNLEPLTKSLFLSLLERIN